MRSAGGTVAWVVPAARPSVEFHGAEVAAAYATSGGSGPLRDRVWHELEVAREDLVVEKTAPSAFFPGRCDLPGLLAPRGIDTVLVAGTTTDVCCESTVRDASTLGHRVVLVADATATGTDEAHNATLRTVYRSFGDVRPTDEILALLDPGTR